MAEAQIDLQNEEVYILFYFILFILFRKEEPFSSEMCPN